MTRAKVNIDFDLMAKAFREHVRSKAKRAGSTIVYKENGLLIEEDPKNATKKVIKQTPPSV